MLSAHTTRIGHQQQPVIQAPTANQLTDYILRAALISKQENTGHLTKDPRRITVPSGWTYQNARSSDTQQAEIEAIKTLPIGKLQATKWRKEHNITLADARAQKRGIPPEQEQKSMNRTEADRQQARRVRKMNGKFKSSGLTRIEIPPTDGSVITCVTKDAIKDGCINETQLKYSQTSQTPPMTAPLLQDIGYLANTPQAQQILDGTYQPPPSTDPFAVKFLEELRMPK
jgi:hypothetical protein